MPSGERSVNTLSFAWDWILCLRHSICTERRGLPGFVPPGSFWGGAASFTSENLAVSVKLAVFCEFFFFFQGDDSREKFLIFLSSGVN